jgi:hypothetical protein
MSAASADDARTRLLVRAAPLQRRGDEMQRPGDERAPDQHEDAEPEGHDEEEDGRHDERRDGAPEGRDGAHDDGDPLRVDARDRHERARPGEAGVVEAHAPRGEQPRAQRRPQLVLAAEHGAAADQELEAVALVQDDEQRREQGEPEHQLPAVGGLDGMVDDGADDDGDEDLARLVGHAAHRRHDDRAPLVAQHASQRGGRRCGDAHVGRSTRIRLGNPNRAGDVTPSRG